MANVLLIVIKLSYLISIIVLALLVWKTVEYFNQLPETHRARPILAWDIIILFLTLISIVLKLII